MTTKPEERKKKEPADWQREIYAFMYAMMATLIRQAVNDIFNNL